MTGVDRDAATREAAVMTTKIIFHALQRTKLRNVFLVALGASDTIPSDNTAIRAKNNHNNRGTT
jgi:hypothetical protein